MIANRIYNKGNTSKKVKNLKRFTKEWTDFEDAEVSPYNEGDADFISGSFNMGGEVLDRYHTMANALET